MGKRRRGDDGSLVACQSKSLIWCERGSMLVTSQMSARRFSKHRPPPFRNRFFFLQLSSSLNRLPCVSSLRAVLERLSFELRASHMQKALILLTRRLYSQHKSIGPY